MIKRTIYMGSPCSLSKHDMQLIINFADDENRERTSIPIEDIGILMLDDPQITMSNALIMELNRNCTAILSCDRAHLPVGLMLPMFSHHAYCEKLADQVEASLPLKKNLWAQTVHAKIQNQAALLKREGIATSKLDFLIGEIKSGDAGNVEGRAAAYYWRNLFMPSTFNRYRFGEPPNNLLNYGYAILRGIVARSLVISGLLPSLGIHHQNKYNPYCLADDIMEPFRPYVDSIVLKIVDENPEIDELTPALKRELLKIPSIDINIDGKMSPLMVGVQRTAASLSSCFAKNSRKILYPELL